MKTFHVVKENYPIVFRYTKPDEYFGGELEKHTWYFSVCDWMGNEIEGFDDENAMLEYYDTLDDEDVEDIQIFVYPLVDDDEVGVRSGVNLFCFAFVELLQFFHVNQHSFQGIYKMG